MTPALLGDERLPRYQRVAATLRDAISRRKWKAGDRLPAELDLAEEYGIAAGTVRQAIAQLVDEGLLERHQGRGTFVRKPDFTNSLFRFFRFLDEHDERRVPESRILVREERAPPEEVRAALGLRARARAIFVLRVRSIDAEPVLLEEIWLPFERFRAFLNLPDERIGPLLYPVYEEVCGVVVARAEEKLKAESVTAEQARHLGVEPGAPVIVIERLAFGYDEKPLEWRRSWGHAHRFQYHTEIR